MQKKVLDKILSSIGEDLYLATLNNTIDVFKDLEEMRIAKSMVARAYLSCLNLNGANIHTAIELFTQAGDIQGLEGCLQIAKSYKNFRALIKIKQALGLSESEVFDGLLREEWFESNGIIWFDLYHDDELGISFVTPEDLVILNEEIAGIDNLANFWKNVFANIENDHSVSEERKLIIKKISAGLEPFAIDKPKTDKRTAFADWCHENGIMILRQLQIGRPGASQRSDVYLVRDFDGKFKVMKEELSHFLGPLGNSYSQESELHERFREFDFLSKYYGTDQVAETKYLRQSYEYGRTIEEYICAGITFSKKQAFSIISDLAVKLLGLLKKGLMYLDLKPANVMIVEDKINLIDLGLSRIVENEFSEVPIYLPWPDYATPENIFRFTASQKTLVYQLGLLYHELVYGKPLSDLKIDPENRQQKILGYAWYVSMGGRQEQVNNLPKQIISMLDIDPMKRPCLEDIAVQQVEKIIFPLVRNKQVRKKEKNTVLFPARMGIPHKGHIDFMARILELGYYLVISIQRSYTITGRDPIPKWIVMKIVAQSLFDKGFSENDFEFRLTPLYGSDAAHRMHFAMMPGISDVVAFASGNDSTHHLFPGKSLISQADVFGNEGEDYENRSWGEMIRGAIRKNDRDTFLLYAASGTEKIITQTEIKEIYGKPSIEFVHGKVLFSLRMGEKEISGPIRKYLTVFESIVDCLNQQRIETKLIDHYSRDTVIEMDGQKKVLIYETTVIQNENEIIHFNIA